MVAWKSIFGLLFHPGGYYRTEMPAALQPDILFSGNSPLIRIRLSHPFATLTAPPIITAFA
jgi:hypothetical protein